MTTTLQTFLAVLFPDPSSNIDVRALPSKAQLFFSEPDLMADIGEFVAEHAAENVYFGVATRIEQDGDIKGDAKHCGVIHALWCDFDFKETPEDAVRSLLVICPTPPSIIVH